VPEINGDVMKLSDQADAAHINEGQGMTDQKLDLAAIKARAEKTPGIWMRVFARCMASSCSGYGIVHVCRRCKEIWNGEGEPENGSPFDHKEDCLAANEDIPDLLREVERLEDEIRDFYRSGFINETLYKIALRGE